jgi:hypothetical protein
VIERAPRAAAVLRLLVAGFGWCTAAYAFVASSPFAYRQFLEPRVLPWLGVFCDWHGVIGVVWFGALVAAVWPDLQRLGSWRPLGLGGMLASGAIAVWNSVSPVLPGLTDGPRAIAAGIVALAPGVWMAVVDHAVCAPYLSRQTTPSEEHPRRLTETRLYVVFIGAALYTAAIYSLVTSIALMGHFEPDLFTSGLAIGAGWTLLEHLVIFSGGFLAFASAFRAAPGGLVPQYGASAALMVGCLALAFRRLIADSIGMSEYGASAASIAVALSIVSAWTGVRLRRLARRGARLTCGLDVFVGPPAPDERAAGMARLAAVAVLAFALTAAARFLDWDFLLLRSSVLAVWLAGLAAVYGVVPERLASPTLPLAVGCVVPLAAYAAAEPSPGAQHVLERYAVHNPGFRLSHGMLGERPPDRGFETYLRRNTGLGNVDVKPVHIDFVHSMGPAPVQPAPLIFLFVVDSLRPDYLSPYNPAATFTPRLAEFAAENLVFTNTFTRYGGTGLSMAAIWAGSAIVHKQYPKPFYPMNALEKLLDANGYRKAFSRDHITVALLKPAQFLELEREHAEMQLDLCSSLADIEETLRTTQTVSKPIFAHTRSLNLHIWDVKTGAVPRGESYPGFHAPYAARVQRIDACFGRFVDFLKRAKLYSRSVIVLTSDHGELLGEDGRWGHSYHLLPPVVQVPLLMRVPDVSTADVDRHAITFTTDIVPTLYSALGYSPESPSRLAGVSVLRRGEEASRARRRGTFVVPASYGPVYAVVTHNGRRLYIADGINGRDEAWERSGGSSAAWARRDVTGDLRALRQHDIRQFVDEVARTYNLSSDQPH